MSRNPNITAVKAVSKLSINARMRYYIENNMEKTTSKTVYLKPYNCYISRPLTGGNSKLDKSILIFDLLAIVTCMNCSSCKSTCYALKSQRQYIDTLLKRSVNTYLAKYDIPTLKDIIITQLKRTTKKIIRIHSSGDFLSQTYLDMWTEIASMFPKKRFYSYTKVDHILDFSAFESLSNVNVVRSLLPDGTKNYGLEEYVKIKARELNAPICPYRKGMDEDTMPHCGKSCNVCLNSPYVLFVQH